MATGLGRLPQPPAADGARHARSRNAAPLAEVPSRDSVHDQGERSDLDRSPQRNPMARSAVGCAGTLADYSAHSPSEGGRHPRQRAAVLGAAARGQRERDRLSGARSGAAAAARIAGRGLERDRSATRDARGPPPFPSARAVARWSQTVSARFTAPALVEAGARMSLTRPEAVVQPCAMLVEATRCRAGEPTARFAYIGSSRPYDSGVSNAAVFSA